MPVEAPVTTANWRAAASLMCGSSIRFQNDLDAAVLLVPEGLVKLRTFSQRCPMRDHEGGIVFSFSDPREQLRKIALEGILRHAKREPAIDRGAHRIFIDKTAVNADH